jgi:hypothetical protein
MSKILKLYELPRCTYFKMDPPNQGKPITPKELEWYSLVYYFDHIDGMYSVCYTDKNEVFHLGASTEVQMLTLEELKGIEQWMKK